MPVSRSYSISKENLNIEIVPPKKDCPYWVVKFPNLFVGAQGETLAHAVQNGFAALKLWVDDCYERGILDAALIEGGLGELCGDVLKKALSKPFVSTQTATFRQNKCHV